MRLVNNDDRAYVAQEIGERELRLRRITTNRLVLRLHAGFECDVAEMTLHVFVMPIDIVFAGFLMDERLDRANYDAEVVRDVLRQYLELLVKVEHLDAPFELTVKFLPVGMQYVFECIRRLLPYRVARRKPQDERIFL